MSNYLDGTAREDFNKAKTKAIFHRILNLISPEQEELLSLDEMRKIIPSKGERYRGLQTVSLELIVGSEGRYQDFTKRFLPRKEHLRSRWMSVDKAHLTDVILPPVQLYEVAGVYFVRDGNHRVSVARLQGARMIDAEVTALDSDIKITPDMTKTDIINEIIQYEKKNFYEHTQLDKILPGLDLEFTATGRYEELLKHIHEHKYFKNLNLEEEISFEDAIKMWYEDIYVPIITDLQQANILAAFPHRTESDLYMWTVKHWHYLKEKYGPEVSSLAAAEDYKQRFGKTLLQKIKQLLRN